MTYGGGVSLADVDPFAEREGFERTVGPPNRDNAFRGCSLDLSGAPPYWLSRCENIRHRLVRFSPYRVARRVASLGRAVHLACEPFDKALALALRSDGATGRP